MFNSNDPYTPGNAFIPASNNPYSSGNRYNPYNPFSGPYRRPRSRGLWGCLTLLILALLLSSAGIFYLKNQPDSAPLKLSGQFSVSLVFLIGIGIVIVLALLQKIFRRTFLDKLLSGTLTLLLVASLVVFLYWDFFINPYVGMTPTSFTRASVNIDIGETLHFQNPSNGVAQILCIGINQKCQAESGAPDLLNRGIRVQPGQTVDIKFDTDGIYHITSENTPGMNITVHVITPDETGSADPPAPRFSYVPLSRVI